MYIIITTGRFEKDVLRCKKRGLDLKSLKEVMSYLLKKVSFRINHTNYQENIQDVGNVI